MVITQQTISKTPMTTNMAGTTPEFFVDLCIQYLFSAATRLFDNEQIITATKIEITCLHLVLV